MFSLKIAALLLFAATMIGCSSSTMIRSEPPGAKLYMNEQYKGETPYLYTDQKIVGSDTRIRLTLDGYHDLETIMSRDEKLDVGALVGGVFFVVPWLWVMEYDPVHTYELKPVRVTTGLPAR